MSILRCRKCRGLTPYLTFSGDTDMVTDGLAQLSSNVANEVVVAALKPSEFSDWSGLELQDRINRQLGRDDLRYVRLIRAEAAPIKPGTSLKKFRNEWAPPVVVFSCPKCEGGEATEWRKDTPSAFKNGAGKLTVLAEIEIRDR